MGFVGRVVNSVSEFYTDLTPARLSGAVDVIVVKGARQMLCTPFHIRVGAKVPGCIVKVHVNSRSTNLVMELSPAGVGYFIVERNSRISFEERVDVLSAEEHARAKSDTECDSLLVFQNEATQPLEVSRAVTFRAYITSETYVSNLYEELPSIYSAMKDCHCAYSLCADDKVEDLDTAFFAKKVLKLDIDELKKPSLVVCIACCYFLMSDIEQLLLYLYVTKCDYVAFFKCATQLLDSMSQRVRRSGWSWWRKSESKERKQEGSCRSLRPDSNALKKLSLKDGVNDITYLITDSEGYIHERIHAKIFLWGASEKIVISDVDGTITRSDALGHLLPALGHDWSQGGIVSLYSKIVENGYKIVYLSSRSVRQSKYTRDYLASLVQEGASLPDGPILLSPDGLFTSLHREIAKRPQEFKSACLLDLCAIFSPNLPFYAGFGNKSTDEEAYENAGIPLKRIFLVDTTGYVCTPYLASFKTTFSGLAQIVDSLFPHLNNDTETRLHQFANTTYWSFDSNK